MEASLFIRGGSIIWDNHKYKWSYHQKQKQVLFQYHYNKHPKLGQYVR